jgi:hypothetical protein
MIENSTLDNDVTIEDKRVFEFSVKLNWLRNNPKQMAKYVFLLFFLWFLDDFTSTTLNGSSWIDVLYFVTYPILFYFYSASRLLLVFMMYWLIDYGLSKSRINLFFRWILNTLLLVVIYLTLHSLIASVLLKTFRLDVFVILFRNYFIVFYGDFTDILNPPIIVGDRINTILMSFGMLWPHLTILVPFFDHISKFVKSKRRNLSEILDREKHDIGLYQLEREQRYIHDHGSERPVFSFRRLLHKFIMTLGYILIYTGVSLSILSFNYLIYMLFSSEKILEAILLFLVSVLLVFIGRLTLKQTIKKLDIHFIISSLKIHWRMNMTIAIILSFFSLANIVIGDLDSSQIFVLVGFLMITMFAFVNSIRLRKKWQDTLAKTNLVKIQNSEDVVNQ